MKSSFPSDMTRMPPIGFGFHPTDEELVNHYLKLKNQGKNERVHIIAVVNICDYEPWHLPDQFKLRSKLMSNDLVWYFFSPRHYKYEKSKRCNRTTKEGYWKPTGKLRKVMAKSNKKQIGTKRSLVFYNGRPIGTRTGWVMQEYEYAPDSNSKLQGQGNFVLYKLKRKPDEKTRKGEPNQCTLAASDFENQDPSAMAANSVYNEGQSAYYITDEVPNQLTVLSRDANDETSHSTPSGFENQTFVLGERTPSMVRPSVFEYQSPHKKGGCLLTSKLETHITASREDECPVMLTPSDSNQTPDANANGDWLLASDLENQISTCREGIVPSTVCRGGDSLQLSGFKKNQISVYREGELPPSMISFDFRSESPYDEKGDYLFLSDLENQISDIGFEEGMPTLPVGSPSDFQDLSIYEKDDCLRTSDLESPISDMEFDEGEQPVTAPSCCEDHSTSYKGEPNCLSDYEFRKVSSDDKTNISVSEEGESSSLKVTPTDFANQNQFQKIDMQHLEDVDWDFLTNFDVESALAEFDHELMANPASEPQYTLNSELQGSEFVDEIHRVDTGFLTWPTHLNAQDSRHDNLNHH